MKILIECSGWIGLDPTDEIGALLKALSSAKLYEQHYSSSEGGYIYKEKTNMPGRKKPLIVQIMDESCFGEPNEAIDDLSKALKKADARWIENYNRANKAEKELEEVKKKLEDLLPKAEPKV